MSDISSFDLSRRIAGASPTPAHAELAKDAFMSLESEDRDFTGEKGQLAMIMDRARTAGSQDVSASSLVYASAFLASASSAEEREEVGVDVSARQMLALASIEKAVQGVDLKAAIKAGGFPSEHREEVARSVYDARSVSDDAVRSLSGSLPVFSVPSPEDENFASRVLSSSRDTLAGDELARRSSMAVEALDVDPEGPDAMRISSALTRISSDSREGETPSVPDLAVRIASDVSSQARASRMIDMDADSIDPSETRIREAALSDDSLGAELELESKGMFHAMPRGAAMDLRSDMMTGGNLPSDMVRLVRLSAERVAEREGVAQPGAETTGEVLAGREGLDAGERREQMDRMPGQIPSHTMEM